MTAMAVVRSIGSPPGGRLGFGCRFVGSIRKTGDGIIGDGDGDGDVNVNGNVNVNGRDDGHGWRHCVS